MTWTLFLDDERNPTPDLGVVQIARDCDEAFALIARLGCPTIMSLDHDLGLNNNGPKPSGHEFMWWLVEQHLDKLLDLTQVEQVIIHSMNPVGARNTAELWNRFALEIDSQVQAILRPALQ